MPACGPDFALWRPSGGGSAIGGCTRVEISSTDDSGNLQTARALGYPGEEVDAAHVLRQHGLASHAPAGSCSGSTAGAS